MRLLIFLGIVTAGWGYESIPAIWRQELHSTVLSDYLPGEYFIISSIYTGRLGKDASIRHMQEVKVTAFGKSFSATLKDKNDRLAEIFTVTLFEMHDPQRMRANYEHIVYNEGEEYLKFSGSTILVRP
ncbi:MAG TPA: hypothetical protein VIS74_04115 [Chthoniobacterales bacterium]